MASEQLEEYLESILDIEEKDGIAKTSAIAKCMRVAPASVTEALQTLADKGFVHYEPYRGAYLTEQGREMARKVKRRHRLLEVFLSDVLHINGENVHEEACKMEHTLSCLLENTPPSICTRDEPLIPVTALQPGQKATIAFIRGDSSVVQRLTDLGLTLKTDIRLVRKAPLLGPVEIAVRRTRLAIDHAIADHIFVTAYGEKAG